MTDRTGKGDGKEGSCRSKGELREGRREMMQGGW